MNRTRHSVLNRIRYLKKLLREDFYKGKELKVITIQKDIATLMYNKTEYLLPRTVKTNYRGELYIHVGNKSMKIAEIPHKIEYNSIIAKCNLIDCRIMDGNYIWVLSDIKMLENPISAKGKNGIWKYDNEILIN